MQYIILFIFAFLLNKNIKAGICLLMVYSPILLMFKFVNQINLFQALSVLSIAIYLIKGFQLNFLSRKDFPFGTIILLAIISYTVTNLLTEPHWPHCVATITSQYLILFPFWYCITEKNNQYLFLKHLKIVMWIIAIYGLIEFILQRNPFTEWFFNSPYFVGYGADRSNFIRFGTIRCHSILKDTSTFAIFNSLSFCILYNEIKDVPITKWMKNKECRETVMLLSLLLFGIIVSVTRSSYVAFLVGFFILIMRKNIRTQVSIILGILICNYIFSDQIDVLIGSITGETNELRGTSKELKFGQIEIVMHLFSKSPIYGLGTQAIGNATREFDALYGAESIWFNILVNYGLLGASVLIFSFITCFIKSIKSNNMEALALVMVFFIAKTLSGTPGIDIGFCLCTFLFLFTQKTKINE